MCHIFQKNIFGFIFRNSKLLTNIQAISRNAINCKKYRENKKKKRDDTNNIEYENSQFMKIIKKTKTNAQCCKDYKNQKILKELNKNS